jgi:hypothetical protein
MNRKFYPSFLFFVSILSFSFAQQEVTTESIVLIGSQPVCNSLPCISAYPLHIEKVKHL